MRRVPVWSAPAETQPTRARSLTIRRLLVRASSRSIAETTASSRGGLIDQRVPTRWTSPRCSSSCSRASALCLLRPAARAAVAVENEPGSLRSAARSRSGLSSVRRSSVRGVGGERVCVAAGSGSGAGLSAVGGSSSKRARQLPHNTTGSRPVGRTISNRRHLRPEWQTPQRRPARSISVRSSTLIGSLYPIIGRESRHRRRESRAIAGVAVAVRVRVGEAPIAASSCAQPGSSTPSAA